MNRIYGGAIYWRFIKTMYYNNKHKAFSRKILSLDFNFLENSQIKNILRWRFPRNKCKTYLRACEKTEKASPRIWFGILDEFCDWPISRILSKLTTCSEMLFFKVSEMLGNICEKHRIKPKVVNLILSRLSEAGPKVNGSTM